MASLTRRLSFQLYMYDPSVVAAVVFVFLFLATTFIHIFQAKQRRTIYFVPLIVGGVFEWIGYIGRALAHYNRDNLAIFIMQELLLLLPPALFAASMYMTLGRIILFTHAETHAPIRARWLTMIFVAGDMLSFAVQSSGGGMMAQAKSMDLGKNLVVIGLVLQVLFFGIFVLAGGIFHFRLVRIPTAISSSIVWQKYMLGLYFASLLILIRSVFRIAEFTGGWTGTLMHHEMYLYIFDSVLMLGVMITFNVVHPGDLIGCKHIQRRQSIQLNGMEDVAGLVDRK